MITPVNLEDIQKSILKSDEDRDILQQARQHACNNTGQIVKTEDGEWVLLGADYEGKLSDLTVKAGGHIEIKNSYRTTGRARGKAKLPVAANDNPHAPKYPGIQSSSEFIRGFSPPDYHLDGVSQKGFLYSTTAMTGTGKTSVLLLLCSANNARKAAWRSRDREGSGGVLCW
jgi:hypothetical protein